MTAAASVACFIVSDLDATDVANELATSLAPMLNASSAAKMVCEREGRGRQEGQLPLARSPARRLENVVEEERGTHADGKDVVPLVEGHLEGELLEARLAEEEEEEEAVRADAEGEAVGGRESARRREEEGPASGEGSISMRKSECTFDGQDLCQEPAPHRHPLAGATATPRSLLRGARGRSTLPSFVKKLLSRSRSDALGVRRALEPRLSPGPEPNVAGAVLQRNVRRVVHVRATLERAKVLQPHPARRGERPEEGESRVVLARSASGAALTTRERAGE